MVAASDAQMLKESDSLVLIRNLLRIGIFNISYIRGLFPEKYFNDKNVPALEMKIKKLMPMDAESKRLIDWMKKGVYDALQKNYLKTLMFCVCEALDGPMIEEYTFSFSYYSNSDTREVSMNFNRNGSKEQGEFKFATTEITTSQMKSSACKMVRTLIQLMGTLDKMPEERTILTKLLCYDDVMPADYEPPFFRGCTEDETLNTWTKIPLKVDNVNSKHFVLALKGVLDPCEDDSLSLGVDSMQPDGVSKSDSKVLSSGMGWAHMLPEILGVIREQLPFYEDYAAFAGVCKSWHSAALQAAKGKLPPSRSPCLMRPEKIGADVFFEVFLLSDDSTHRIRPPEEHGRHGKDLRSSCGWLISLAGDHCLQMINPFSGIIFDLPKLDILGVYGHQFMGKVVFLAESSLVVAVLGEKLVFCRIGDDNWKTCTYNVFDSKIMDITCYNGRVYSLDCDHYIRSYDVCGDDANSRVDITRLAVDFDACEDVYLLADYIIGFDDGDKKCLLAIIREAEYFCDTDNYKTISFQVWCFDLGTRIWSRVQDLGSKSMFVGGISSSFLVEQDSTTGIKRNCIYFTSPDILFYKYGGLMDMGIYHLSDGTIESINTRGSSTYLTPSFWLQSDNSGTALQPKIASAAAENLKESEITEHDSLLITRNLLCMGISTISYIRGLFPEKYFNDKNVPALEMKIKKLMPMDAESKRLIDWMEKGVYDALQKKYLKTLMFCVCEALDGAMIEEYAFSFGNYSNSDSQEVSMNFNRIGCKKQGEFKFATTEITASQMKSSACKMVRTLIQLMRTLDKMPEEATILMKLLYYDATPADYEPPFFRGCTEDETLSAWTKNPLKMEVGNVNSKHFVLALKVKSVLDPCEGDDLSLGGDLMQLDGDSESDSEPIASIESYAAAGNEKGRNGVNQDDKMVCSGLSKRPRKASTVKDLILLTPESQ